jgi:hypothetical protein
MTLPFTVLKTFTATSPISGRERLFEPGDTLICDTGQTGATLTFEFETSVFLVDRSTFKRCCIFKNEGVLFLRAADRVGTPAATGMTDDTVG